MQRTCTNSWCQQSFEITAEDIVFYETISPVFHGKKYTIPPPTRCPMCRQKQRWHFQNQRFLYKRASVLSGQDVISAYAPESPFRVCEKDAWATIDNRTCGRPYDFTRPFFEQFQDLFLSTIKSSVLQAGDMINAEYTHFVGWMKNCFLVFDAGNCEDCLYSNFMGYNRSCVDTLDLQRNELCYDAVDLNDCYGIFSSTFCRNCASSAYLFDCVGCKHCLGCLGLRNQEYCIFNKRVSAEEFHTAWQRVYDGTRSAQAAFKKEWQAWMLTQHHRALHNTDAGECTGEYLVHCQHAVDCYKCVELRDAKHCQYVVLSSNDVHDVSAFGESLSYSYQLAASGGLVGKVGMQSCAFNAYVYYGGADVYYSIHCLNNCKSLFGCCDLHASQYCILNAQYTQDEYEALVPRIIEHMRSTGEWGEFFPSSMSPFAYNESLAQDHFPLSQAEAEAQGFRWRPRDIREYEPASFTPPDQIDDMPIDAHKQRLACERCGKNYRYTPQELSFYMAQRLPAPVVCPECRYCDRLFRRNPQTIHHRRCAVCSKEIQTTYSPDRPENVVCEAC